MPLCGGTSEPRPADAEIQKLCEELRASLEEKSGKKFAEFTVLLVSSQVVAGTNYFVKIHVGGEECVHARIFRPLPHTGEGPQVHSVQLSKTKDEPLAYF
jgi:cystatin-A/B